MGPHGWIERGVWVPVKTRTAATQYSALVRAAIGYSEPWDGVDRGPGRFFGVKVKSSV